MRNTKTILACVLLAACNQKADMTTVINNDGSCERILIATADERFVQGDTARNPFVVPLDGWDLKWEYKNRPLEINWPAKDWSKAAGDSLEPITAIAHRHFNSIGQLADSFKLKPSHPWKTVGIQPVLQKNFRWFYTYYSYRETFARLPIKLTVPAAKYLSANEAGYWFTGKPDLLKGLNGLEANEVLDGIDKKAGKWMMHNLFDMQYAEVLNHLGLFNNSPGNAAMVRQKDSVFAIYYDLFSKEKEPDIVKLLDENFKLHLSDDIVKETRDSLVKKMNEPKAFGNVTSFFEASFDYRLLMPGNVVTSNGTMVNDTLTWKIDAYRLMNDHFTIEATSKKTNNWMFAVTVLVVAVAAGLFFIRRK